MDNKWIPISERLPEVDKYGEAYVLVCKKCERRLIMKILVEGNSKEIERTKLALESVCLFNGEFCISGMSCEECETKQNFKIEYIVKR